jgi:FkbM family methyltransferase
MALKFNDRPEWKQIRIKDVQDSYFIPDEAKHGIAVDVGGNIGAFSLVHSKDFHRIIAFEPATESVHQYILNTAGLDNVQVYRYAVSDKTGQYVNLKQWNVRERHESGNASIIDSPEWSNDETEEVMTISIEDIFYIWQIERINFLKCDCEGGEYDFLMNKDLSRIDYLSIEIHKQLGEKAEDLKEYLNKYFTVIEEKTSGGLGQYIATYENKLIV